MHMALNSDAWMKLNTSYCNRMSAWISARACDANREATKARFGDSRCAGCNGLNHQDQATNSILTRSLAIVLDEVVQADLPTENLAEEEDDIERQSDDLLDEDELDQMLEALFPEPPFRTYKARAVRWHNPRKVFVFMGRCRKCGGYMVNSPERQFDQRDEDVYRCFSCSWRTSPAYSWNRNNLK